MNYILKNKKAIAEPDILAWGRWFQISNRVIKQETLPNGRFVSTVFLGIDHSFGEGVPLLFETMVFPSRDDLSELDMDRYSTYAEAVKGHRVMVKKWLKAE